MFCRYEKGEFQSIKIQKVFSLMSPSHKSAVFALLLTCWKNPVSIARVLPRFRIIFVLRLSVEKCWIYIAPRRLCFNYSSTNLQNDQFLLPCLTSLLKLERVLCFLHKKERCIRNNRLYFVKKLHKGFLFFGFAPSPNCIIVLVPPFLRTLMQKNSESFGRSCDSGHNRSCTMTLHMFKTNMS